MKINHSVKRGIQVFVAGALPIIISNMGSYNWGHWQDLTLGAIVFGILHWIEKKYII